MLFEVGAQGLAYGHLDGAHDLVVAELRLGLSLKLGLHDLNRDYGGQTLAEVVACDFNLGVLEQVVVLGVFLKGHRQAAAEAGEVCAALDGVDVVYKRIYVFVVGVVVGERYLHRHALALGVEVDDVVDERFLARVDVFHKLAQALVGMECLGHGIAIGVEVSHVDELE